MPASPAAGGAGEPSATAGRDAAGSGEAGEAGAPNSGCSASAECDAGSFCQRGSCAPCAELGDLTALEYGNVEPLTVINVTAGQDHLRYVRPAGSGAGLVYVRDFFGGHLWFTSDPSKSAGAAVTVTPGVLEHAGLYVPFELPEPLGGHDFFFHRSVEPTTTQPKLFGAKLGEDGSIMAATELPEPFNQAGVTASHTLALSRTRAVWTRNVDGQLDIRLMTLPLPPAGSDPSQLRLPLGYDCGFATELDYTPWLTPDGTTLFFTARAVDPDCSATVETVTRLYVIGLSASGEPQGNATMLHGLTPDASRQTDPALSPDGCHLYFSAQDEAGMSLYRAERVR